MWKVVTTANAASSAPSCKNGELQKEAARGHPKTLPGRPARKQAHTLLSGLGPAGPRGCSLHGGKK